MLKKLQIKFVSITMTLVTLMLCVIFGLILHFTQENLEAESLQMMQALGEGPLQLGRPDESQEEIRLPYFVLQINQWGQITATGGGYFDLSDEEFLEQVLTIALTKENETGSLPQYNLRYCRVSTPFGERLVFADTTSEQATLKNLVYTCVGIGVISFLAFLGISLMLARWAVKPVEEAWKQQRQFVADASHELKTPLTVILTNAELLQTQDGEGLDRTQFSDSILIMARQMRTLVERLLELARVDNGSANLVMGTFDFSELISDGLLPFEPVFFERGLTLQSAIAPGLQVEGSTSHLRQVLDILLDNAMKYSAPEGEVWVTLKKQGSHALLAVSNPGPSITAEDQQNIFKRFYRVDKARSRDGSYGLGLSIAQSIVTEHKGKIWVQSQNGINTFFVQLPAV